MARATSARVSGPYLSSISTPSDVCYGHEWVVSLKKISLQTVERVFDALALAPVEDAVSGDSRKLERDTSAQAQRVCFEEGPFSFSCAWHGLKCTASGRREGWTLLHVRYRLSRGGFQEVSGWTAPALRQESRLLVFSTGYTRATMSTPRVYCVGYTWGADELVWMPVCGGAVAVPRLHRLPAPGSPHPSTGAAYPVG